MTITVTTEIFRLEMFLIQLQGRQMAFTKLQSVKVPIHQYPHATYVCWRSLLSEIVAEGAILEEVGTGPTLS